MSVSDQKPILKVLSGEPVWPPPVWLMRQAGRYLPEYKATRAEAGSFLDLCYTPELAAEVTLQPIRRFGFEAAILFADILLIPQALGMDLWFEEGEGPRLRLPENRKSFDDLGAEEDIHETLSPIYQTVSILAKELPRETTLIGFAGAPWTVATYMVAGRGTPDQGPARRMMYEDEAAFSSLMARITKATCLYLGKQIEAGAEVVKLFDSWAGSVPGRHFEKFVVAPAVEIRSYLKERYPGVPFIGFPRGAGERALAYQNAVKGDCIALDTGADVNWAAEHLQGLAAVQGNMDPMLMVIGGSPLEQEATRICRAFAHGPHIFNLGHGITPDADPDNVKRLLDTIRELPRE